MDRLLPFGPIALRQSDRGNAEHRAFHRAGDRAGIGDVVGDILAAVDAGEDEIRLLPIQDRAHAHDDAIGRRALHREAPFRNFAQPQRIVERERMGDARLIIFRRDDEDIIGKQFRDPFEHREARRMNAVVIGDQYAQF